MQAFECFGLAHDLLDTIFLKIQRQHWRPISNRILFESFAVEAMDQIVASEGVGDTNRVSALQHTSTCLLNI
jgi:hypothetical protein